MNFFEWIRQGVKQSVLRGVADAVDHLGTPVEQDKIREQLLAYASSDAGLLQDSSQRPVLRRRLGRGITPENNTEK